MSHAVDSFFSAFSFISLDAHVIGFANLIFLCDFFIYFDIVFMVAFSCFLPILHSGRTVGGCKTEDHNSHRPTCSTIRI